MSQGTVLSLFFFLIFINDVSEYIKNITVTTVTLFSDDYVLDKSFTSPEKNCRTLTHNACGLMEQCRLRALDREYQPRYYANVSMSLGTILSLNCFVDLSVIRKLLGM